MNVVLAYCRTASTGDVNAAAKVDTDKIASVHVTDSDGGDDNSDIHQLPLVVREIELPGWHLYCVSLTTLPIIRCETVCPPLPRTTLRTDETGARTVVIDCQLDSSTADGEELVTRPAVHGMSDSRH